MIMNDVEIKDIFNRHIASLGDLKTERESAIYYRLLDATESIINKLLIHNVSSRLKDEEISHAALLLLGYTHHICGYYCAPYPADGATYRLGFKATIFKGGKPIKGTEKWSAYITHSDCPTIRRFKTLGELSDFHKGMCGRDLLNSY